MANPHNGPGLSIAAPQVRLRVDGGIGLFTGGSGQTYALASDRQTSLFTGGSTGQSIALTAGATAPFAPSSTPSPVATPGVATLPAVGSASAPGGFERLPTASSGTVINNYVGLRILPDHTLTPAASGNNPQVTLYFGTDSTHQFNATMEYLVPGTTSWVPYNHFIGINDQNSWINGATLPVRTANSPSPATPNSGVDQFNTGRLIQNPPSSLMKGDPRATRFGIFQLNSNITSAARITEPLWPSGASTPTTVSGYGGLIYPSNGSGIVEHVPLRFDSTTVPYYPATFARNMAASSATVTSYADQDGILRPADAAYPDPGNSTAGSSTPYYTPSKAYWPIMLNRPVRSVAELGYVFRDLPWKTLDLFTDKSADSGLLDVFCVNDGTPIYDTSNPPNVVGLNVPTMVAGNVNLNTGQAAVLQSILAGTIWDELNSANSYPKATSAADSAQTMAPLLVSATSTAPVLNRSDLVSRTGLPNLILPANASQTDQLVKAQREAVPRALASVGQTRTWNLMIDVIAQSGSYPPGANDLANFVVQGEQRYWVHVAIDRFTGQVIGKQIEVVNE